MVGEITKDMLIADIVDKYPKSATMMRKMGLHCVSCHVASFETLEEGARGHGLNADKIIEELNTIRG
ncbi:disulfide oxidoreductase [Candidatus Woesearchaeota archaeon CG11_big_fil_rev_8_21_14_0_20_43_8]|nr:MAG: disulfide oxidoreductase [Candidatus Woesearchaeota archaeon CG11_big_fil_rev_8_21_14_0_20_43_8]PIO05398.1 MAG: disulfide oxidoreductase [Candidatus Woesearchaeota archaeon CG08_land_8_20_14_0_20_43_7]